VGKKKGVVDFVSYRIVACNKSTGSVSFYNLFYIFKSCLSDSIQIDFITVQLRIAEEVKLGIARYRIVLGGVSQGGALALYSSFAIDQEPLAGIVAMSTWVPLPDSFPAVSIVLKRHLISKINYYLFAHCIL